MSIQYWKRFEPTHVLVFAAAMAEQAPPRMGNYEKILNLKKMSGYPTDDEPAPLRYMSVPEEIQFTSMETPTAGTSYHDHSYMRVPDTITLDDPHPYAEAVVHIDSPPIQASKPEQITT